MITLHNENHPGTFARIWVNDISEVESEALHQVETICKNDFVKYASFMPDIHTGIGVPVGAVIATDNVVIPNLVGVDIGCGMCSIETNINTCNIGKYITDILHKIKETIPLGFNIRGSKGFRSLARSNDVYESALQHYSDLLTKYEFISFMKEKLTKLNNTKLVDTLNKRIKNTPDYLGSLGGGNHFAELQRDEDEILHIMLHSGSRGIGEIIARIFMTIAKSNMEIWKSKYEVGAEFLPMDSEDGKMYFEAVKWAQEFAFHNREVMLYDIKNILSHIIDGIEFKETINIHHNYVNIENHYGKNLYVHRKGATRVRDNIKGIIPGSMGTSSFIVTGTNNEESLNSCSHGAGRAMSRTKARSIFNMNSFNKQMEGIISLDIDESHLDESPSAYKDIDKVMMNQQDLVNIEKELWPIANVKG